MKAVFLALIALLQQSAPAAPPPVAKGAISGVVLHGATGDPIPNVNVTIARMDPSSETSKLIRQMAGQDPEGAPPVEMTVPVEFLESMKAEMAASRREMETLVKSGQIPKEELENIPPEMALMNSIAFDDVHSLLVDPAGKVAFVPKSAPPIQTDGAGKFGFDNLEPGAYRLIFAANGFVRQDYGQRGSSAGTPLLIVPGGSIDTLVTRLTPTGGVSGHITDGAGQPVAGVSVQLSRLAYDATGKKTLKAALSTRANDKGEYRFYYLTPGRYFLRAGTQPQDRNSLGGDYYPPELAAAVGLSSPPSMNRITDQRYAQIYYPAALTVSDASAIDVTPGNVLTDVDMALNPLRLYAVRGRIIDARSGGTPPSANIRLLPAGGDVYSTSGANYNAAEGTFEFREVPNGSYELMVELPPSASQTASRLTPRTPSMSPEEQRAFNEERTAAMVADQVSRPRALVPVVVGNADVNEIVVSPGPTASFGGRFRIENAPGRPALKPERLFAELRKVGSDTSSVARNAGPQPQVRSLKGDGTFQATGAFPGEYWLRVRNLPEGFYVKSARLGEADALNRPIALPISEANTILEIVIGANAGEIEGVAATADGRPAPGADVVLVPDRNRERIELFRSVNADATGHFKISDVVPGEYHVAVWQFMEPFAFFDPDYIKQAEEKGKELRVAEASKQTVTVEPIAVESEGR